jgi:hypothetical protein
MVKALGAENKFVGVGRKRKKKKKKREEKEFGPPSQKPNGKFFYSHPLQAQDQSPI